MSWRSIDFHGIVSLDKRIVDQLNQYLQEKESRLAQQIYQIIQPVHEPVAPVLPIGEPSGLKLTEALEVFSKKLRQTSKKNFHQTPMAAPDQVIQNMNSMLWEYTEVLEGCVTELFQQIKQVSIDKWHRSLLQVVQSIKELLVHRIEDLIWVIRRLETSLQEYRKKSSPSESVWKEWVSLKKPVLDPALLANLSNTDQFLKKQYDAFYQRYQDYVRLSIKVEDYLEKMKSYPILAILEMNDQNLYVDVFRLLKLWELNPKSRGVLANETTRSLKNLASVDAIMRIFRLYYQDLKDAFFNTSLDLKEHSLDPSVNGTKQGIKDKLAEYRHELQQLIGTMSKYREFMLRTDASPYVRSRWGFTEWVVGPEPLKARKMFRLILQAEELRRWYDRFLASVDKEGLSAQKRSHLHYEIDRILHEMGQPLISQAMMRRRAARLLENIQIYDEIGNLKQEAIPYVGNVLSKAMRADWKYHVMHEFPLFHEIYHIHLGLQKRISDPSHSFRIDRFKRLFAQIEEWVNQGDIYAHVHEIELDINDMKTYLQDFLASLQRAAKDKSVNPFLDETINKFRQQLLEYRYLFGQFFLKLVEKDDDSRQLRNQFLFVDQYFESVEHILHDLENVSHKF
jgi:hypothetical protein